jgi:hypothetical protein
VILRAGEAAGRRDGVDEDKEEEGVGVAASGSVRRGGSLMRSMRVASDVIKSTAE